jgi:Tol biopolymer transport system component
VLFLAPVGGGAAKPLVANTETRGEQAQRFPVALPDGRHVLYLSWTIDAADRAIHLADIEDGSTRVLVKSGFPAGFIAPDLLVYVRDRALVAQRFSIRDARLLGEPMPIAPDVGLEAIPGQACFTASASGIIAYRTREGSIASEMRRVDRTGRAEVIFESGSDISVAIAPDRRRAAVARQTQLRLDADRFPSNIWLLDLQRRLFTRLTLDSAATDENPTWSPDGSEIAFARHRAGGLAEVIVQGSTGGASRVVVGGPLNFHPIDWSSDGTLLLHAYATRSGADNLDLYTLAPGASEAKPFIEGTGLQAQGQFSPDGVWIAYTSSESGQAEVYVAPLDRPGSRLQVSSQGGAQPRWRDDGRELYYVSLMGDLVAVPLTPEGNGLAAGQPQTLFSDSTLRVNNGLFFYGGAAAYDVEAGGRTFLINRMVRAPGPGPLHVILNWRPKQ